MARKKFIFKENMEPQQIKVPCGVGVRVEIGEDEYFLACVAPQGVVLIDVETGYRYTEIVEVEDVDRLTSAEWVLVVDDSDYEVI